MTIDPEPLLLALLTGLGFGFLVHWLWDWSASKAAAVLVLFWTLQTFAQQLWRIFEGTGGLDELLIVGSYRLTFATAAIVLIWLVHRRCEE